MCILAAFFVIIWRNNSFISQKIQYVLTFSFYDAIFHLHFRIKFLLLIILFVLKVEVYGIFQVWKRPVINALNLEILEN